MQAYDSARFDPPAPVASVVVKSQDSGIVIRDVPMLLDTGAPTQSEYDVAEWRTPAKA